jgi:P27 family predicted phage terminase small subunit
MSKTGRPRIPTKIHYLRGTERADRTNLDEPQPEVKIPEPPPIIKGIALEEWNRITKELHDLGLVSELNRCLLAGYCKAYGRWIEAEQHYETEPKIYKTESGYPIVNPWRNIADKALEQMHKFARGFGMDPESMSRIRGSAVLKANEKPTGVRRFLS